MPTTPVRRTPLARTAALAGLVVAPLLAPPALAQGDTDELTPPPDRPWSFTLTPRAVHYFTSDLDDDSDAGMGDVSVSRFGLLPVLQIPVGDDATLAFNGEFTYSFYNFDGSGIFDDSLDLLDDAYEAGLGVTWSNQINEHWLYAVGGGFRVSAEAGADVDDALTGRFFGTVNYRVSENFVIGGGVGVSTELDDDVLVVPIISAFYQPSEKVVFAAGGGPAAAGRTLGATITYRFQPDVALSFTGAWDYRQFRLDDDGPIPDGITTDQRVDLLVGLDWGITPTVTLRLEAGATIWQEYEFIDSDDDHLYDVETDPTAFIGGGVTFEF
ncbi:MAG: hypothetical protein R3B68_14630 [Phycisphaerales bacterium]